MMGDEYFLRAYFETFESIGRLVLLENYVVQHPKQYHNYLFQWKHMSIPGIIAR